MFTGIIEVLGNIESIRSTDSGLRLNISSEILAGKVEMDDSVAVNGICLTIAELLPKGFALDVVRETVIRSTVKNWRQGTKVNLERGMPADGRFDGHIVQGHVDGQAELVSIKNSGNSAEMLFKTSRKITAIMVEKGSVTLDGISLTIASLDKDKFSIAVIPYTLSNTTFKDLRPGKTVNIETDIIGKYIAKYMQNEKELNKSTLRTWGYEL